MTRTLLFAMVVLMAIGMAAQTTLGPTTVMLLGIGNYTGANLQSRFPAANWPWYTAWVSDGPTCAGGGFGPAVLCYSNGTSWVPVSSGGGGGGGGTVTNNGQLFLGQPVYGNGSVVVQTIPIQLAADAFPGGGDICAKIMAAQGSLSATGGVIVISPQNYAQCATSITINTRNVTLRGAGMGNWGLGTAATVLNFPPGVPGIIVVPPAENVVIENMYIKSASTVAGTDDGITLSGGSPRVSRVIVQGFGRNGIVFNDNTDLWRLENVYADSNKHDGFYWTPGCHDENAGMATVISATSNGNLGYELQCGGANNFQSTHASNNAGGAWLVNVTYNYFYDTYVEEGVGSSFTFTPTSGYNTAYFNGFGQPSPLIDNGVQSTNQIYYEGAGGTDGGYPAQTSLSLTGPPQQSPGAFYSFVAGAGAYYYGDLIFRDRKNAKNMAFYANNIGWDFTQPVNIGLDNQTAGVLSISNGSLAGRTIIQSHAIGNVPFNLPPDVGMPGNSLTTDGNGNTSWAAVSGGPGGVSSVTGTGTVNCNPTTGNVVCNGTAGGITNSAGPNVVMKSDGTNAVGSSLTDDGANVVTTEPLNAATLSTGAGALGCPATGCFSLTEAAPVGTPTAGYDYCRADSVSHTFQCSFNGGPEGPLGGSTSVPFGSVTPGTNGGALVMGNGGSMTTSGNGTIAATSVPAAGLGAGTISNNTTGTAANLSGTPTLPTGTTIATPAVGDNSTRIATTAFVAANAGGGACNPLDRTQLCIVEDFIGGAGTNGNIGTHGWGMYTIGTVGTVTGVASVWPRIGIISLNTNATAAQGQGEAIQLGLTTSATGDLRTNTNWTFQGNFQLQDITTTVFRIGLLSTANAPRPSYAIALRYDVNSPLVNQAITSISCTTTSCTVTNAGGTLNMPGQQMTISGATCATRNVNGTQTMTVLNNATTWAFASSGTAEASCPTPGTVSTVAETNFKFYVQNGNTANATVVDSGLAADTAWHNLQIQSTVAGTVVFTLDSGTPVSISTANVTTNNMAMGADLCTDSTLTGIRSVYLDRFAFYMTGLTR